MLCFCGFVIIYTFKLRWGFGIFVSADSFVGCVGLFSWSSYFRVLCLQLCAAYNLVVVLRVGGWGISVGFDFVGFGMV